MTAITKCLWAMLKKCGELLIASGCLQEHVRSASKEKS